MERRSRVSLDTDSGLRINERSIRRGRRMLLRVEILWCKIGAWVYWNSYVLWKHVAKVVTGVRVSL